MAKAQPENRFTVSGSGRRGEWSGNKTPLPLPCSPQWDSGTGRDTKLQPSSFPGPKGAGQMPHWASCGCALTATQLLVSPRNTCSCRALRAGPLPSASVPGCCPDDNLSAPLRRAFAEKPRSGESWPLPQAPSFSFPREIKNIQGKRKEKERESKQATWCCSLFS